MKMTNFLDELPDDYPIIILRAQDWCADNAQLEVDDVEGVELLTTYIVGLLVYEGEDRYVIGLMFFRGEKLVRHTVAISKSSVDFVKIIKWEDLDLQSLEDED